MAVAFLAVNPVTVIAVVNGGHNDALIGLALIGGVLLVAAKRPAWAGAVMALGVLVKIAAAPARRGGGRVGLAPARPPAGARLRSRGGRGDARRSPAGRRTGRRCGRFGRPPSGSRTGRCGRHPAAGWRRR